MNSFGWLTLFIVLVLVLFAVIGIIIYAISALQLVFGPWLWFILFVLVIIFWIYKAWTKDKEKL